ncbi:hypothetical protein BASA50_007175 [Batrachochytrium salamandrivorans]|uniref:Reverse transcriptase domain-containing protein n=1 Tax=Batrachochytrium salamandrivorans TaxID=1357716 RepID=A0ABQ8F7V2_9FUNG|nr:hypothetical protein BASA50_007175 [Batrachochytrium salamandrivorans]
MESTSPDDPGAEDSLKYIIHYLSDSCQPLHTSGQDKGGSLTKVRFGARSYSLHRIWDAVIPHNRVRNDFQRSEALYASYLIESIKTGENRVLSKSWTSKLPIDALNDIGNSMVAIEYTSDSYELSCSVVWPKYNEHRKSNFDDGYYKDVIKTVDMQISKAGLRVAQWINHLARLNPQTAVEAATPPTAQPGESDTKKHTSPPQESMPQSKKDPSMSSKKLASGAQKPDDPTPSSSDHDDHQVVDDADTEWQVVKKKCPRSGTATTKGKGGNSSKGKGATRQRSLLSDPFPVQRGVRQGCPLSGLLFNLFINDILDGVAPITVPGLPRDTNPIRGLMYADDVAVFADSERSLLATSTAVEQWANRWEMQFGVAKCGIISFTGHLAPRLDNPLDIRLHGQLVSRVESCKYLGVLIDSKLDHSAWLKQKRSALEHTISALYPVLANHQLTVNYRSCIFSAVVMGKAYYGLELVGGNKSHLAPPQTTINKGIRLFTGARLSTAIGPLLVETGIGSLLTRSLVSRVRLLEQSVTKRTPINAICSGTDNDVFTLNVQGQLYVTRQFLDTSGFFKDPSFDQSRVHGTRYLMLARMDALWTARKAIQIGILVDTHPFSVNHCILCDQQLLSTSIAHLVVECEQVTGHRIQSGLVPAIQKSRLRLLGRALDPGVENVYTWLRGGVLNGEADLDQRWLDGTVEHESMGTRHDNRMLAARLADFLQVAYRQYQSTLWKYHRDRLVGVG